MARQRSSQPVPLEGTLFEGNFVDTLVAEQGTTREAIFQELGLEIPKSELVLQSLARAATNTRMVPAVKERAATQTEADMPQDDKILIPPPQWHCSIKNMGFMVVMLKRRPRCLLFLVGLTKTSPIQSYAISMM